MANRLVEEKKNKEAIALLEIAERLYLQRTRIYYHLAMAYKGVDKHKVIDYLQKCIDLNPSFRPAIVEMADQDPSTYKQVINLAHQTRSRNQISRSDALYKRAYKVQQENQIINRTYILQNYINLKNIHTYLEIGVFVGHNLLQMKAPNILVVDPFIQVPNWRNNTRPYIDYYELTSDDFFEKHSDLFQEQKIQACLIDGLHTYEQSLKDVLNTLDNGDEDCLIIMHDCKPVNKAAAEKTMALARQTEGYNGMWMGDVYKSIIWLRAFRDDVQAFVLDCDCGLGIVRKGKPESRLNLTEEQINQISYEDLVEDMDNLLNLKPVSFYHESVVFK